MKMETTKLFFALAVVAIVIALVVLAIQTVTVEHFCQELGYQGGHVQYDGYYCTNTETTVVPAGEIDDQR